MASALGARPRAGEELRKMRLDGMTDRAIARTLLAAERHGAPHDVPEADIDAVLSQYLRALEQECAAKSYAALPGVVELLPRLAGRSDVLLGLCTGNLETGARHGRDRGYSDDPAKSTLARLSAPARDTTRRLLARFSWRPACGCARGERPCRRSAPS